MALSSSWSPTLLTTTQSSSPPKLVHSHSPLTSLTFPSKPTTTTHTIVPALFHKWRARISFFPAFSSKGKDAKTLKEELLDAIASLDRGADATPEDQQAVDQIARKLEVVTPVKEPLKSGLLDGKWELLYTTSKSLLQTGRPKFLRSRVNYQAINVDTLRAQNMESWPTFNQIPVKAPDKTPGELEITYLDEELRVSRGDKGNLFILKLVDPSYRVPV